MFGFRRQLFAGNELSEVAEARYADAVVRELSPTTLDAYRGSLDRYVLKGLGRLRVRELTPGTVDRFIKRMAEQHGNASAKLARSVVSGVAAFAVRMDLLMQTRPAPSDLEALGLPDPQSG